eukprot:TRINITY_DN31024_c0_g1_i1.p1 TRINITY_DN31024_c0_g1~~TRINITY_DN31024_c0_g1_i1.p1  ORF type:complete len:114 (-),score=14.79 TRINITY_DN31024_c0_g1_i1:66-407(-)
MPFFPLDKVLLNPAVFGGNQGLIQDILHKSLYVGFKGGVGGEGRSGSNWECSYGPSNCGGSALVANGSIGTGNRWSSGGVVGPLKITRSSTLKIGLIPMSGGSSNTCIWTQSL